MPATCIRPSAVRRTSSTGLCISNCSKPSRQSDCTDTALNTRGSRRASRPCASNRRTSRSSSVGMKPDDCAWMSPISTFTPKDRVAKLSSSGRHSLIRGTITACNTPQLRAKRSQAPAASQSSQRVSLAASFRAREGGVKPEFISTRNYDGQ